MAKRPPAERTFQHLAETVKPVRAIVHIGMPKTGSTAIQRFLIQNADALSDQGVLHMRPHFRFVSQVEYAVVACNQANRLIPDRIDRVRFGVSNLEDQRALTAEFEKILDKALEQTDAQTFVISSEQIAFWLRRKPLRKALDRWLQSRFDEVRYLMFLRPMEDFILSVHSEAIRRGSVRTQEEFVAREKEQPMVKTALNWRADFGDRVTVLQMGRENGKRIDLYEQFCSVLGVESRHLARPAPANQSLNKFQQALLRRMNRLLGPLEKRSFRKVVMWRSARLIERTLLSWGPKPRLTESQRALIRLKHPQPIESVVSNAFEQSRHANTSDEVRLRPRLARAK